MKCLSYFTRGVAYSTGAFVILFNWGWKKAVEIGDKLLDIADELEKRRLYKFAEQIRGAGLSMSNNTCPVK